MVYDSPFRHPYDTINHLRRWHKVYILVFEPTKQERIHLNFREICLSQKRVQPNPPRWKQDSISDRNTITSPVTNASTLFFGRKAARARWFRSRNDPRAFAIKFFLAARFARNPFSSPIHSNLESIGQFCRIILIFFVNWPKRFLGREQRSSHSIGELYDALMTLRVVFWLSIT